MPKRRGKKKRSPAGAPPKKHKKNKREPSIRITTAAPAPAPGPGRGSPSQAKDHLVSLNDESEDESNSEDDINLVYQPDEEVSTK